MQSKKYRVPSAVLGFCAALAVHAAATAPAAAPAAAADTVYRHGRVYTIDAHDSVQQALAIRAGRIVYVGSDAGAAGFIGPKTTVLDLRGRMLMPGLVDGHMHPLQGGGTLLKCNLNYEQLDVAQCRRGFNPVSIGRGSANRMAGWRS